MSETATAAPNVRHVSIDAVRGFAVLGILLMNIVGMGLPSFAYIDPTYAGNEGARDLWTWAVNAVLTDGKMRYLFSMLFGASAVLIAERAEGGRPGPLATHYRRMFWLFVFGMIHAYFFWFGDILVPYALAGLMIFPFRRLQPRTQMLIGTAVLALLLAKDAVQADMLEGLRAAAAAPGASAEAIQAWAGASQTVVAPPEMRDQEIAGFGGGFWDAFQARAQMAMLLQLMLMPTTALWEALGLMFLGMGLFRTGFFTLGWSTRAYLAAITVGYLLAVPLAAWQTQVIWRSGFEPLVLHEWSVWQALPRPFIALAHASVLLLVIRAGWLTVLVNRLAAAGRMAFSNYLLTSIITSLVFCGYGLGLYGQLSRFELYYVVAGVWLFILAWSLPWLAHFHYGPFEWAWRSLVKWSPQPFARGGGKPAPAAAE